MKTDHPAHPSKAINQTSSGPWCLTQKIHRNRYLPLLITNMMTEDATRLEQNADTTDRADRTAWTTPFTDACRKTEKEES